MSGLESEYNLHVSLLPQEADNDWPTLAEANPTTDEDAWSTVVRRPRRTLTHDTSETQRTVPSSHPLATAHDTRRPRRRTAGIVGRNTTAGISAYKKRKFANVFASRFAPDLEACTLKETLEHALHMQINSCVKLESKHPLLYSSVNISTNCNDPMVFMDESIWPADCYVHWMRKRRGDNTEVV